MCSARGGTAIGSRRSGAAPPAEPDATPPRKRLLGPHRSHIVWHSGARGPSVRKARYTAGPSLPAESPLPPHPQVAQHPSRRQQPLQHPPRGPPGHIPLRASTVSPCGPRLWSYLKGNLRSPEPLPSAVLGGRLGRPPPRRLHHGPPPDRTRRVGRRMLPQSASPRAILSHFVDYRRGNPTASLAGRRASRRRRPTPR